MGNEDVACQDGIERIMAFQKSLAKMQYLAAHSDDYSSVLNDAFDAQPCSPSRPWKLVLYQDRGDPMGELAKHHARKARAF